MNLLRGFLDKAYDSRRNKIFTKTAHDPEIAHEKFIRIANRLYDWKLEKILLNCSENQLNPRFEISNAAGFNKNGDIPPSFLRYLGFDRVVVGTVTADEWGGNERPRIKRYPETGSMVNWMGLPGAGANKVAENLLSFVNHNVPVTINLMATPGKVGEEALEDLGETTMIFCDFPYVDRFELNISCPNTHSSKCLDARVEYQNRLASMVGAINHFKKSFQHVSVKVSPDLDTESVKDIVEVCHDLDVYDFITTNTTTEYDSAYITTSPNQMGFGGASGRAVYEKAFRVQKLFEDEIGRHNYDVMGIIACGGIDSARKAKNRTLDETVFGIQIYTPLIFRGPKLLRELRTA